MALKSLDVGNGGEFGDIKTGGEDGSGGTANTSEEASGRLGQPTTYDEEKYDTKKAEILKIQ